MTLLVALKGSDGMVLAADSRGTFGDPRQVTAQNDSIRKAFIVAEHVAVLQAGSAELGAVIVKEAKGKLAQNAGADGVATVLQTLRETATVRYNEWFPSVPQVAMPTPQGVMISRPDLVFIVGGYDVDAAGSYSQSVIYQLPSGLGFAPMLHDYGFAVAGVPTYALYLLNRLYEADRKVDELVPLAVYTISETASQDGKVGGPVRVIRITPAGSEELGGEQVEAVMQANHGRATALRSSFYRRGRQ